MKKSKKVLLSAAIAAAIMGSVSLPQIQAAEIGSGVNLKATTTPNPLLIGGGYDVKTANPKLNVTLATQEDLIKVNSELAGKANAADIANQVITNEVVADNVNATNVNASNLKVGGQASFNDNVSMDKNLNVGGHVEANTIKVNDTITAEKANVVKGNISNLSVSGKAEFNGTDGVSISDSLTVGNDTFNVDAESGITSAKNLHGDQLTAGNATFDTTDANTTKTGTLTVTGDTRLEGTTLAKEIGAGKVVSDEIEAGKVSTKEVVASDSLTVGNNTFNVDAESGITSAKNLHGDQLTAGNATFDTTDANTTKTGTLTVTGDTRLEGTTLAKEIGAGKVVSDEIEAGKTTTDSLTVTGNTRLEGTTLAKEIGAGKVVSDEIEAGKLAVGNINDVEQAINNNKAAADNAQSTANAAKDAAAANKTAITKETNDRTAADTVLSNRITENSSAIQSLRHDVSDLGTEIDNVGAISAALAGLHPLDWNGSGSKFQLSAAAGTYDGKQAMALGGFYHPNRNMMLSLGVSSSLGSDRKTAGNIGITFRVGKGSNGTVSDDVAERLAAMDQKISQLESQNQKLTSMLAIVDPSLTKEFPDVPANHWAYEAVSKLAGNDIIEGYPDGDFHGDRAMTRYEIAQVIYKALKKGGTVDQKLVKEFNKEIEAVKANDAQ